MEVDLEIHDQDQDQEQRGGNQSTTTRSYECTFCQRGFTNAQALGGHMNLHRKDKARLKQSASISSSSSSASKNKMPWDIPKIPTSPSLAAVGGGENATLTTTEETLIGHDVRQLPLFIEKPSNMDQELESQYQTVQPPEIVSDQKTVLPDDSEVDLELRLGPEPQNSTSSSASTGSISTKQFF